MLYKINDKFYIKVNGYFVEVVKEVGPNNDIILKPTENKIEYSRNIAYEIAKMDDMEDPKKVEIKPTKQSKYNMSNRFN